MRAHPETGDTEVFYTPTLNDDLPEENTDDEELVKKWETFWMTLTLAAAVMTNGGVAVLEVQLLGRMSGRSIFLLFFTNTIATRSQRTPNGLNIHCSPARLLTLSPPRSCRVQHLAFL